MNIYDELGLKRLINAAGTYTVIGGSKMSRTTLEKMNEIAGSNVDIKELQEAIHKNIAKLTRNEACVISAGAIAGIYLALASTISFKYKKQFKYLTKKQIQDSEIIMFKAHRNPYDRSIDLIGCSLIELGYANNIDIVDKDTLENAITENTCAIFYLPENQGGWIAQGALDIESTISIAKKYKIPVIVDAAAQLPPKSNLWKFTEDLGADAVIFSGGKYLKGPQSTGVVLGKKRLLDWVDKNNFPNYDIGRMHKISREDLVGIYQAIKEYMESNEVKEINDADYIVKDLICTFQKNELFHFEYSYPNEAGQPMPRAKLINKEEILTAEQIRNYLLEQEQAIYTKIENGHIYINPMMLTLEEYKYVKSMLIKLSEEK